ncbi:type VI secretion system Vgr family protein, partial [Hydromonas duriensis]
MNPLDLFGRHRNLAITSAAIPSIIEGVHSLDVIKIEGKETLNGPDELFSYTLLLKTPSELSVIPTQVLLQSFDLSSFLGKQATVHIALDDSRVSGISGVREITGIISSAQFKRVAERSLIFEIKLIDWLSLGKLNTDYAIHQDKTPIDTIVDTLNSTFPYMFENRTNNSYPERDYCVRMGEDAATFVKRLCQEYGINLHYEHKNGAAKLILSDGNNAFKPVSSPAFRTIRYHADPHAINEEHWHSFSPARSLTTGAVSYRDHDYMQPNATNEVIRQDPQRNAGGDMVNHGNFEQYHFHSDAFANTVQPLAGRQKTQTDPVAEGQLFTLHHLQSIQQFGDRATAQGNIRGVEVGSCFTLTDHPMAKVNMDYVVVESKLLIEEIASETQRDSYEAQKWLVQNTVELQPTNVPVRPPRTIVKPRVYGVEIAKVVGDGGNNSIWTDEQGRIKIAFPWHREDPKNQYSSCWVRVVNSAAGNQQGSMHLPRINDEILISYIGGDPDLPICTGRVHNGMNKPSWQLPKNQALSGYRSRELKPGNQASGRSNHLILDDSADAIQLQIKSDADHSMLSLGQVTRIDDNEGLKDKRGEGAELRTDGKMALRANKGMLITTQGRAAAESHITDLDEAASALKKAHSQVKATGEAAAEHQAFDTSADAQALEDVVKQQNDDIKPPASKEPFPELASPHLVVHSVAGLETVTPESTHVYSGEHLALTTGKHVSMSIGQRLLASAMNGIRLFAQASGIKLFAAAGKVEIQAQSNDIDIIADKVLK